MEAPVKSGGTDSSIALKSDRNLSKFHDAPRVSTANHINLPHGEGSPMSENLEHSDSTEELVGMLKLLICHILNCFLNWDNWDFYLNLRNTLIVFDWFLGNCIHVHLTVQLIFNCQIN